MWQHANAVQNALTWILNLNGLQQDAKLVRVEYGAPHLYLYTVCGDASQALWEEWTEVCIASSFQHRFKIGGV